ncbi:RNA polymerase sigma factor RpoS [uncultured archaeon]|nr:RNA polymerase sigma factor RpoS [uncultured archaeon]
MLQPEDTTRYRNDIARVFNRLTKEQERALGKRLLKGDQTAIQELVEANLPLVIHLSRRYTSMGMTQTDIIQEGNIGLIRAARCFDYRKNVRFSTHAGWYIFGSILRALEDKSRLVRIPGSFHYANMKMKKRYEKAKSQGKTFKEKLKGDPHSEYNPENYEFKNVSLDNAFRLHNSDERAIERMEARDELSRLMVCLLPEELDVISRYFGLNDLPAQNFREIAQTLKISQSKAKSLVNRALVKMGRLASETTRKPATTTLSFRRIRRYLQQN